MYTYQATKKKSQSTNQKLQSVYSFIQKFQQYIVKARFCYPLKVNTFISGITITDNGHGKALVKRVKPGSVASKHPEILPGDHIQSINGESMVGSRHYEVAKVLKSLPVGIDFKLVLIEPKKEFDQIAPRSQLGKTTAASNLARTLSGSTKHSLNFHRKLFVLNFNCLKVVSHCD